MNTIRNWLLPLLLAAGQLGLWPGALAWAEPEALSYWLPAAASPTAVAAAVLATVLVAAALGWRRRRPVAALVGIVVVLTLGTVATPTDALLLVASADLIALYSVAVRQPRRTALIALGLVAGWQLCLSATTYGVGAEYAAEVSFSVVGYLLVVGAGLARQRWLAGRRTAAARLSTAEAAREQATADERQRLAHELHDVSAHHLTSVLVAVTAAQRLRERQPELMGEGLALAATAGRRVGSGRQRGGHRGRERRRREYAGRGRPTRLRSGHRRDATARHRAGWSPHRWPDRRRRLADPGHPAGGRAPGRGRQPVVGRAPGATHRRGDDRVGRGATAVRPDHAGRGGSAGRPGRAQLGVAGDAAGRTCAAPALARSAVPR